MLSDTPALTQEVAEVGRNGGQYKPQFEFKKNPTGILT